VLDRRSRYTRYNVISSLNDRVETNEGKRRKRNGWERMRGLQMREIKWQNCREEEREREYIAQRGKDSGFIRIKTINSSSFFLNKYQETGCCQHGATDPKTSARLSR